MKADKKLFAGRKRIVTSHKAGGQSLPVLKAGQVHIHRAALAGGAALIGHVHVPEQIAIAAVFDLFQHIFGGIVAGRLEIEGEAAADRIAFAQKHLVVKMDGIVPRGRQDGVELQQHRVEIVIRRKSC